ncbi:PREDICTED: receptor-like protein 12 [Tarenaya hassleriana]|uniref:receptor-like protein 12 n=1 Tax=Tarenaya hassleriana TaxID=28532 RepID=UPI00053C1824|nr:PREDICTED: receptor-like protein 12 [Tarenaya hassleriana]
MKGLNLCTICFSLIVFSLSQAAASPTSHLCRSAQREALLGFKHEFPIQKMDSWRKNTDCCLWDGVICDANSGDVIELDASSSLFGGLKPNSRLFRLGHLQSLNLAHNDFNLSSIPTAFNRLTRLTRLNLSHSSFSGRIPIQLLELTKLVSLDLTSDRSPSVSLSTEKTFLSKLARNLTNLGELYLNAIDISSSVPTNIFNLSSLRSLHMDECRLAGEFPSGVFLMPNLESLSFSGNIDLRVSFPEFNTNSSLVKLDFSHTSCSGNLPGSIGNLVSLNVLDLAECGISGTIPSSLGNLSRLNFLALSENSFIGEIPSSFSNLNRLTYLALDSNKLTGGFPVSIFSLTELVSLDLSYNNFTNMVPSNFSGFKRLEFFNARGNSFTGAPSSSLFMIPSLKILYLSQNQLTGPLEFRNISLTSVLLVLGLGNNHLRGSIPTTISRFVNLVSLSVRNNHLSGTFPRPPQSIKYLNSSRNDFSGEIPGFICELSSLEIFDVSSNNFSGSIPPCLGNSDSNLTDLNLQNNNLVGCLSKAFKGASRLRSLDIGHNQFEGKLPRSLLNSIRLEVLNVESNKMRDTFPFWLKDLPELQVLVLRSNEFYGSIYSPDTSLELPKLHIIDISHNHFNGSLPSDYFSNWTAMSSTMANGDGSGVKYMGDNYYSDSVVLMNMLNKGVEMELVRILTIYTAIDFSGNRLQGKIPESVGLMKELHILNLSRNAFIGSIPPSLAALTELESLDLSENMLSGQIPPELGELSFLSYLNFSCNRLEGPIPQGTQFQRQPNSSFERNLGLCGLPLSQSCGEANTSTSQQNDLAERDAEEEEVLSWVAVAIGLACGLLFGLTFGQIYSLPRMWEGLMKTTSLLKN